MSLPPETIQVKRKIDHENGPVHFLRVDEPKRQRSGTWLYERKQPNLGSPSVVQPWRQDDIRPVIHTSRTGNNNIPPNSVIAAVATASSESSENGIRPGPSMPPSTPLPASTDIRPRRFHMTRPPSKLASANSSNSRVANKARYTSAVFVERGAKRRRAAAVAAEGLRLQDTVSTPSQDASPSASAPARDRDDRMEDAAPLRFKRPGLRRKANEKEQGSSGGGHKARPPLPPSLLHRQHDGNMEQLARDMDAYTLEHIGLNLAKMDEDDEDDRSLGSPAKSASVTPRKYRPKAPAKRYAERHPEAAPLAKPEDDVDMQESDTEDDDYVIETYVRVPASTLAASIPAEQVGVLVFDNEPDIEFFYGAESDSEEEHQDDDDDSNAEDYYTADYPEDEVESDDEYDRDPYHYRNGNASDLEEFDEDHAVNSDVESTTNAGGIEALRSRVFGVQRSRD